MSICQQQVHVNATNHIGTSKYSTPHGAVRHIGQDFQHQGRDLWQREPGGIAMRTDRKWGSDRMRPAVRSRLLTCSTADTAANSLQELRCSSGSDALVAWNGKSLTSAEPRAKGLSIRIACTKTNVVQMFTVVRKTAAEL